MIDIHSHILNNVDDGSDSLSNSIDILKKAEDAGFTDIILTPHYIEDYYENTKSMIKEKIEELKKETYKKNIIVQLHQGNEILLTENTVNLLNEIKISTLADSRYVLYELPFSNKMMNLGQLIYEIRSSGYIPILAHPERYSYIQENPSSITEIINYGTFIQSNYGSFTGQYGKSAKKTAEILLENHITHFLGSDTHKHGLIYKNIDAILKKLYDVSGDSNYIDMITTTNPRNILNDFDMYIEDYPKIIKEKKKTFFFI